MNTSACGIYSDLPRINPSLRDFVDLYMKKEKTLKRLFFKVLPAHGA